MTTRILLPIVRGDRATVGFAAIASIFMIAVAATLTPAAFAQSGDVSDDSAADHSGWVRSGDVETDNAPPDQVLEVPSAAIPSNSNGTGQAAPNGDSSPDQVGSVDDYQDEDDTYASGIYIQQGGANPYGFNSSLRAGAINPAFGPTHLPSHLSGGPNLNRPGNMTTPHSRSPIPGGWWNRAP